MCKDKSRDAYLLMVYACNCGHKEVIWNSRDGDVPFSVPCSKTECNSVMSRTNDLNIRRKNPKLPHGSKYFVDMTEVRANLLAFETCSMLQRRGTLSSDDFDAKLAKLSKSFYADGKAADLLTN